MRIEFRQIRNGMVSYVLGFAVVNAAYSDGYRNPPATAEGIAKSDANKVFVNDASAVSYNPANLAMQTNTSFVSAMTLAHSKNTYVDGVTGQGAVSDDPWQPLPNTYISAPLGDTGIALGFGITTPFGQGIQFDKTDLIDANTPAPLYEAQMALINLNPSVAVKLGEHLALGVGADVILSRLTFKQHFPWPGGNPAGDAEVDALGYAFGGNAGVTWFVTDKQRLALTYRSPFKVEYEGDFEVSNFVSLPFLPPGTSAKSDFETAIEFPTIIGLGYGIELTDSLRVEMNIEWLEWSLNQNLALDLDNNQPLLFGQDNLPNNWNNTITVGVGADWQIADGWVLRAGYAFIETPIPDETISPLLPDADRHALSFGVGYTTGRHSFDLAQTVSIYEDRDVSAADNPVYPGSYDIASDLLGLTYSCSF